MFKEDNKTYRCDLGSCNCWSCIQNRSATLPSGLVVMCALKTRTSASHNKCTISVSQNISAWHTMSVYLTVSAETQHDTIQQNSWYSQFTEVDRNRGSSSITLYGLICKNCHICKNNIICEPYKSFAKWLYYFASTLCRCINCELHICCSTYFSVPDSTIW